jgi:hypothetical protein
LVKAIVWPIPLRATNETVSSWQRDGSFRDPGVCFAVDRDCDPSNSLTHDSHRFEPR